jgi:hypothetical protein
MSRGCTLRLFDGERRHLSLGGRTLRAADVVALLIDAVIERVPTSNERGSVASGKLKYTEPCPVLHRRAGPELEQWSRMLCKHPDVTTETRST